MSLMDRLVLSNIAPVRRVEINQKLSDHASGVLYRMGKMIIADNDSDLSITVYPDLEPISAQNMALFLGLHDVVKDRVTMKIKNLTVYMSKDTDIVEWIVAYMSHAYKISEVYQQWMNNIHLSVYRGWQTFNKESVLPVKLSDDWIPNFGYTSMIGPVLLDGKREFVHGFEHYSELSFPDAGQHFSDADLDKIDRMESFRVDEDGTIHVYYEGEGLHSVSRGAREILNLSSRGIDPIFRDKEVKNVTD